MQFLWIGLDWSGLVGIGPVVHRIGSGARENCASCSDFIRPRRSREKTTTVQWLSGEFNFKLYSYLCFETKSYFNFHSNRKFRASQLSRQPHKKKLLKKRRFDPHKVRFRPLLSLESLILSRIAIWKFDSSSSENLKKVSRRSSWRVRW